MEEWYCSVIGWGGETRNMHKTFAGNPEGIRPARRCKHGWEEKSGLKAWVGFMWLRLGADVGFLWKSFSVVHILKCVILSWKKKSCELRVVRQFFEVDLKWYDHATIQYRLSVAATAETLHVQFHLQTRFRDLCHQKQVPWLQSFKFIACLH